MKQAAFAALLTCLQASKNFDNIPPSLQCLREYQPFTTLTSVIQLNFQLLYAYKTQQAFFWKNLYRR